MRNKVIVWLILMAVSAITVVIPIILLIIGLAYLLLKRRTQNLASAQLMRQREIWPDSYNRVREGYYCERDDVAFDPGGLPQSPAMYATSIFEPFYQFAASAKSDSVVMREQLGKSTAKLAQRISPETA